MSTVDLVYEMAAARERRAERTRCALRDSRVLAIRAVVRAGATRADIQEIARSFYPRLSPDLLNEATEIVCEIHRIPVDEPPVEEEPIAEATAESVTAETTSAQAPAAETSSAEAPAAERSSGETSPAELASDGASATEAETAGA